VIRINLLPPEYSAAQSKNELKVLVAVVSVVVVSLGGLLLIYEKRKAANLDQLIAEQQVKLDQYKNVDSQIQRIESDKRALQSKRDVIRNLNSSRLIYPVFFEDLLPLIPSDVWISDIKLDRQAGPQLDYKLTSRALSNFALATWLTNMEQSTHFSNVKIDRINYEYAGGAEKDTPPVLSFQLSFSYQHKGPLPLSEFN
jgi:Tfp pilus assembly protein PilN